VRGRPAPSPWSPAARLLAGGGAGDPSWPGAGTAPVADAAGRMARGSGRA